MRASDEHAPFLTREERLVLPHCVKASHVNDAHVWMACFVSHRRESPQSERDVLRGHAGDHVRCGGGPLEKAQHRAIERMV
eukprot:CAMPEP_0183334054 /NCGR_PEP_ID=MMETSP0164_2-20130417/2773_1 /TAXON_ID=221442 /ORGANISM="Coccolithus pelagicus ssp braarudi, Strain PLY182g" /LENGTH=80 /DNA_ID=CAMNT_0025503117 /DNA_START=598 /DNA_END=837 /DNA_ORIENTATION=+